MSDTATEFDFDDYVERHGLHTTDHPRVWWAFESPDYRAYSSATYLANEFPELTIVGTESRTQMSDVQWQFIGDDSVVVIGYYPLRADKWDHAMKEDFTAYLTGEA